MKGIGTATNEKEIRQTSKHHFLGKSNRGAKILSEGLMNPNPEKVVELLSDVSQNMGTIQN